jgi:gliding motility-associated-like protein
VTNEHGCEADAAGVVVTVNLNPEPVITATGDGGLCDGESIILATGFYTDYQWSTGDTTQAIVVDSAGTYTVTVTNSFGCEGTSEGFEVIEHPTPEISIEADGPTMVCAGDAVTLNAIGNGPYLWNTGQITQSISVTIPGDYFVTVLDTVTGCVGTSDVITISNHPPFDPEIAADGPTSFCEGEDVVLTVLEGELFSWSTGDSTQSIAVDQTGVYVVNVVDTNGCNGIAAQTVTVLPSPTTGIVPDLEFPYCQGDTVVLTALGVPIVNDFEWNTGETTQSIEVTESGVYTVTVSNFFGCSSTASLPIGFLPTPTAEITIDGSNPLCEGDEVTLTSSGFPFLNDFLWNTGETTQSITVTEAGSYSVTVTNLPGCSATSEAVVIEVVPAPTASAGPDVVICAGDTADLFASGGEYYLWTPEGSEASISVSPTESSMYIVEVTNEGCNQVAFDTVWVYVEDYPTAAFGYGATDLGVPVEFSDSSTVPPLFSWEWDFGDGHFSYDQNPVHDYEEEGEFTVTLIVSTQNGCTDTVSQILDVDEFFIITNVLTPNNDGLNDYVWIKSSLTDLIVAKIYNRWGVSVWEGIGNDLRFTGKTSSGTDLPAGTYYYVITLDYEDAGVKEITGYITLIR